MATLTIEDRTATGTPIGHIDLPDMPDRITLRDLIRLRVREEVARYNLQPLEDFQGLVQPEGAVPLGRAGYRLAKPRRLDGRSRPTPPVTASCATGSSSW